MPIANGYLTSCRDPYLSRQVGTHSRTCYARPHHHLSIALIEAQRSIAARHLLMRSMLSLGLCLSLTIFDEL